MGHELAGVYPCGGIARIEPGQKGLVLLRAGHQNVVGIDPEGKSVKQ